MIALRLFRLLLSLAAVVSVGLSAAAHAASPYQRGLSLPPASLDEQLSRVEKKLEAAGFRLLGRHQPKGVTDRGVVIYTDAALLDAVRKVGGHAVLAAGQRVGVSAAGEVSYTLPNYWLRAYFRDQFAQAAPVARAMQARLEQALGRGETFGGDVSDQALADYRYMAGMEKLDSIRAEVSDTGDFDTAVRTVRAQLAAHAGETAGVYELVLADRKLAVWGVALNHPREGEGVWVNKLGAVGPAHVAALPYEVYVIGGKIYSPPARYRIALAWPALDLGQFMSIRYTPDAIAAAMRRVANVPDLVQLAN
jgi:hypothetical protein